MPIFKSQAGGSPCDIFYDIKGELESVDQWVLRFDAWTGVQESLPWLCEKEIAKN